MKYCFPGRDMTVAHMKSQHLWFSAQGLHKITTVKNYSMAGNDSPGWLPRRVTFHFLGGYSWHHWQVVHAPVDEPCAYPRQHYLDSVKYVFKKRTGRTEGDVFRCSEEGLWAGVRGGYDQYKLNTCMKFSKNNLKDFSI